MTRITKLLLALTIVIFLTNCSKDSNPIDDTDLAIIKDGEFTYLDDDYATNNLAFNSDNILFFYSDSIMFSAYNGSFIGKGDMVKINLQNSIFNDVTPSINNFIKDSTFEIIEGTVFINYDINNTTGAEFTIKQGSLKTKVINDSYSFEYDIELEDGSFISGEYQGGLIAF